MKNIVKFSKISLTQSVLVRQSTLKGKDLRSIKKNNEILELQQDRKIIDKILEERQEFLNPMMALSYSSNPIKVKKGRGQYLYEENSRRKIILDCINNVSHIGHCHP